MSNALLTRLQKERKELERWLKRHAYLRFLRDKEGRWRQFVDVQTRLDAIAKVLG